MSTNIISFQFHNLPIRTQLIDSQAWFVASDVCSVLGYKNSRRTVQLHCKEKGVTKRYTPTLGGDQEVIYINEPNIFRLIIKSKKEEAIKFEEWVMEEVLPTIRKTGSYSTHTEPISISSLPAYTHRVLTYLSYGLPVASMLLAEDQIVMSVESFKELAIKSGWVVAHSEELKNMVLEEIIKLINLTHNGTTHGHQSVRQASAEIKK